MRWWIVEEQAREMWSLNDPGKARLVCHWAYFDSWEKGLDALAGR